MRRRTLLYGALSAGWLAGQGSRRPPGSLAFVAHDALWIQNLPDGQAQRVASGADILQPRISPSGDFIAYQRAGVSYLVSRAGGGGRRLGAGAGQWRPDRDELLLEQPHGMSLFTGANGWAAPVGSIPDAALPLVFSPDDDEIVFSHRSDAGQGSLRRAAFRTAGPSKTIISRAGDGMIPCAWAGGTLLYWMDPSFSASLAADGLELFSVPAAGGTPRSLGITSLLPDDFLSLSPAADRLAVTAGAGRESWRNKRIALFDFGSGASRYLTGAQTAAICPSWSPDGARIAFVALPENLDANSGPERRFLGQRRIWVSDAAGNSQPLLLTGDDRYRDEHPVWLADGRHILFCRISSEAGRSGGAAPCSRSIWLLDTAGGGVTQLAGPLQSNDTFEEGWFGYYGTIDWRPVMDCHSGQK
jgi:hypothetical protein